MITRKQILDILNTKNTNSNIIYDLYYEYIKNNPHPKLKSDDDIYKFIQGILNTPFGIENSINQVLNYFKIKFTIHVVIDKNGNLIKYY